MHSCESINIGVTQNDTNFASLVLLKWLTIKCRQLIKLTLTLNHSSAYSFRSFCRNLCLPHEKLVQDWLTNERRLVLCKNWSKFQKYRSMNFGEKKKCWRNFRFQPKIPPIDFTIIIEFHSKLRSFIHDDTVVVLPLFICKYAIYRETNNALVIFFAIVIAWVINRSNPI